MALIHGKQLQDGSISDAKLATPGGRPSKANKGMAASVTTADHDLACATAIAAAAKGTVEVQVNGVAQILGDADRAHDCYFSADSGATALAADAVTAGALLYWNGTVAGFELAATDKISFFYNA